MAFTRYARVGAGQQQAHAEDQRGGAVARPGGSASLSLAWWLAAGRGRRSPRVVAYPCTALPSDHPRKKVPAGVDRERMNYAGGGCWYGDSSYDDYRQAIPRVTEMRSKLQAALRGCLEEYERGPSAPAAVRCFCICLPLATRTRK